MTENKNIKLGQLLLEEGLIDYVKLYEALEIQKVSRKKLGEILLEKGYISELHLCEVLSRVYGLPLVKLSELKVDKKLLGMFSYKLLKKHKVFPVEIKDRGIVVATNNPLNISAFEEIRYISGYQVKPVMATLADIELGLNRYYGPLRTVEDAIKQASKQKKDSEADKADIALQDLEMASQDAPVVKIVNSVISEAIKQNASDIHFEPQKDRLRVRFRIDGMLYEKVSAPKELLRSLVSRIKIISGMDVAEVRKPQDGRMSLSDGGKDFDIRVSTLPDIFGEKVVLRILNKENVIRPIDILGMDEHELNILKDLIYRPYGMILFTGPTGSGKTTTLYSILNLLNDASRNIVTVEDPVEYELDGVNQTAINVRAGYQFATAIRHILRQDPDVIMIGEIRDLDTVEIAIQAALTGHLVLATLHTNTASGAITRLLDMNVEPFLISSAVIGVVAQRLVRRLCPACKKEYPAPPQLRESLAQEVTLGDEVLLAKPAGCEKCFSMGYSGRIGNFEVLNIDDDIRQLILKRANEHDISRVALSKGMKTLRISGIQKALSQATSLEEVMRTTFLEE